MIKKYVAMCVLSAALIGCSDEMNKKGDEKENKTEVDAIEKEVQDVSLLDNALEYQKQLETDFESDMESFDEHLNQIQSSIDPIVTGIYTGRTLREEEYPMFIADIEVALSFLENMQDYSDIEKYRSTYFHFKEGNQYLDNAYSTFNSFFEESNQDASTFVNIFFKGFETYNLALEKFRKVGEVYAQEHRGIEVNATNTSDSSPIELTINEEDGLHFWKGKQEVVNGQDWTELDEEEKLQLISLVVEHVESSGTVNTQMMKVDYVEAIDNYFQEQTKLNERIKDVFADILLKEIS